MYSRVTKVLAPWLNFIVQLASSQPPLMVLKKAEKQTQETEPPNFYSSPLIQTEEDIPSGKFEAFLSHHSGLKMPRLLLHGCTCTHEAGLK